MYIFMAVYPMPDTINNDKQTFLMAWLLFLTEE
jgi:hypothetical protein